MVCTSKESVWKNTVCAFARSMPLRIAADSNSSSAAVLALDVFELSEVSGLFPECPGCAMFCIHAPDRQTTIQTSVGSDGSTCHAAFEAGNPTDCHSASVLQRQPRFEPAARPVMQRQRGIRRERELPGDREAQARSARMAIARGFEPVERLEYRLQRFRRNAGP